MSDHKKVLLIILIFTFFSSYGQETPVTPISNKIFSPVIINPAVAGSKDFLSLDLIASFKKESYTQVFSGNSRLLIKGQNYGSKLTRKRFSNIGIGGAAFNDLAGEYRNLGISLASAYHFPLSTKKLSFFSIGAAVKGIYSHYPGDSLLGNPEKNTISPNVDAGLYYYNPNFFAGFSATNILGNPDKPDSLGLPSIPVSREYFFNTGFKIVISRQLDIVIEPSVLVNTGDTISRDLTELIHPALKVYLGNFCLGSYMNDYEKIPFFIQYKYPEFYIGTFFELPRNTPFYKEEITAEIVIGINITSKNLGFRRNSHW